MSATTIRTLEVIYNPDHLIDGADLAVLATIDLPSSYDAYEEAVESAISAAFDGATVVVRQGNVLFTQLWGDVDAEDYEADLASVQEISNAVFERGTFWQDAQA
jgi:hypothetical protein